MRLPDLLKLPPCLLLLITSRATSCLALSDQSTNTTIHSPSTTSNEGYGEFDPASQYAVWPSKPLGLRKMSTDPGEKFFMEYWSAEDLDHNAPELWSNLTSGDYVLPLRMHSFSLSPHPLAFPRALKRLFHVDGIQERDHKCLPDTFACTNITRPNSCCQNGSRCEIIPDTGHGDVGCCPSGETCTGQLTSCPPGYQTCSNDDGGGCCSPGSSCDDVGCISYVTTVVVLNPTTSIISSPSSTATVTTTRTVYIAPSGSTTTLVPTTASSAGETTTSDGSNQLPATTTVYTTVTVHPTTTVPVIASASKLSTSGPASSVSISSVSSVPSTASSASFLPPVKGTTATTKTNNPASSTVLGCPTGFYACEAYYQGGCCRTGRDCQSTSCPAYSSVTPVSRNSVTVVEPSGCPDGWFSCAATNGGQCCPSGHLCGASCTPTGTASGTVAKLPLSSDGSRCWQSSLRFLLSVALVGLVLR